MTKKISLLLLLTMLGTAMSAQSLLGAWERQHTTENGENLRSVVIFTEEHQVMTMYNADNGKFIHTNGGAYTRSGDVVTEKIEFNTDDADSVGSEVSFKVIVGATEFEIVDAGIKFKRLDDGTPGELQGAWLMSGRVRDGKVQDRDTSGPRKTMKILSGTRFQWIAYNTETKQFMGTGGGTYTTVDGTYTENIEFFSKDATRVGASLSFSYALKEGKWNHSGLSSKGAPIHEIWSKRK